MLRLRLSYLYLGQSSSKTPSISEMKTWWQYWWAIILLQENVLNLYQFLNVNKEIPFIIFQFKKKPNEVCIFDYCLRTTSIYLTLAIVFCLPKRSLSRSQKEKKLKKTTKKSCLLKLVPKHYASLNTAFVLSYKLQFPKFPSYYFAFW